MKREVIALTFACLFPSAAAAIYFVWLGQNADQKSVQPLVQAVYSGSKFIQFAFPVIYLMFVEPSAFRSIRLSRRGVGLGIAFGLMVAVSFMIVAPILVRELPDLAGQIRRKVADFGVDRPSRYILLAVFLSVIHSALEEYYWRWFVFGRLRRMLAFTPAAVISSLAFMAHHVFVLNEFLPGHFLTVTVPGSLAIAVGGFVWAWLFERTGSIGASWISHLLVDAGIMFVGFRLIFGS